MVRGRIRPKAGVRGKRGRGKIDGNRIARVRPRSHRIHRQKFRNRKSREPQQVPRGPRTIVIANDFDSHSRWLEAGDWCLVIGA